MRTRFLNTDYFSSSSSLAFETLGFLNLPVPDVLPALLFPDQEDNLLRFGSVEDLCLPMENFSIDTALSKFFLDVVPDRVSVEYGGFEIDDSSLGGYYSGEKNDGVAVEGEDTLSFNVIQFETPEFDFEMEKRVSSKMEDLQLFSEFLENGTELGRIDEPDIILQNSEDIQQKIYYVDHISSNYFTDNNISVTEDGCIRKNQSWFKDTRFPLLEVDEINLSKLSSLSKLADRFAVLETMESQDDNAESLCIINSKELIGSKDYDLLDILSKDSYSNKSVQSDVAPKDSFSTIDIVTILDISYCEGSSQSEQRKVSVDYDFTTAPVTFEEFQFLDVEISDVFDIFICLQKVIETKTCSWMFSEELNFKNFSELIVSSELAFTDDAFKSLPTPLLYDYEIKESIDLVFEDVLSELKPQSLSASNDIYLHWHLLDERKNNHDAPFCDYTFEEIVTCNIDLKLESSEGDRSVFDFIFSEDSFCEPLVEKSRESFYCISTLDENPPVNTSHELLENPRPKPGAGERGGYDNYEKATQLFKLMSTFDDLTFFMDPQKAVAEMNLESATTTNHEIMPIDSKASCISGGMHPNLKTEDMIIHSVRPSEKILALVGDFEKSYITLVKDESELISTLSEDKIQLLSISKEKLIDCIRKAYVQKSQLAEDRTFTFALLLAIKQMTWYMCFFGIHVAFLYLNKLCRSSVPLKLGLHTLYSSIETEQKLVGTDITKAHPSLAVIRGILQSELSQRNSKALLLSEQSFWSSLKRLLISMGLSYNEFNSPSPSGNQPNVNEGREFKTRELGFLPISDCLIVSHEQVSPSFPLANFTVIVEYGGSNAFPKFSSHSNLASFPRYHFIKMELDMSTVCGQLCAGVAVPYNLQMRKGDELKMNNRWLEEVLNLVPLESVCYAGSSETTKESEFFSVPQESGSKRGPIKQGVSSDGGAVIVVNTKTVAKEMIISRRSTYHKVLAMEKEGVQVVERDSDLPVDLMLSSSICLLWYDCENPSKKPAATIGASSSSLSWIGDIATNVLTSLSFSFSSCIMVFEGESACLASIMESSDELYAAAGSLGISLQIFCSSSAELSDDIILRCITSSVELSQVQAKMLESETLAESFLTKFPSVNPLTAQAILSSAGSLFEFLKLPHSSKVQRMQKYHVPEESADLFNSLCRYGVREDSKSVMTDSSSSVSSGPDSDKRPFNFHSGSKEKQYITGKDDIKTDDLVDFFPSANYADEELKPLGDFQLHDSWSPRDHQIFHFDPVAEFSGEQLKPSGIIHPDDSWPSKDPEIFDNQPGPGSSSNNTFWEKDLHEFSVQDNLPGTSGLENWKFPVTDEFMSQQRGCKFPAMTNLNLHDTRNTEGFVADYKGEVINIADSSFPEENFPPSTGHMYAPTVSDIDEDLPRKSKVARRLSFIGSHPPNFPRAAAINSNSVRLDTEEDSRKVSSLDGRNASLHGYNDNFPAKRQRTLLEEVLTRRSAVSTEQPFKEEISHCGGSPLSNAIHSSNPQGSPWTIEFLNRVRERSRARKQQSLPPYFTSSSLGTPGSLKKTNTKRKSPSILEFFKYKGGSRNFPEEKKQKQSKNSSTSSKDERYHTPLKSWTPIDKRAKQSLSFAVNGTGSQTKLVWK